MGGGQGVFLNRGEPWEILGTEPLSCNKTTRTKRDLSKGSLKKEKKKHSRRAFAD